jgi:hypothetical protein
VIDWQSSTEHLLLALKTSFRLQAALDETFSVLVRPSLSNGAQVNENQL